MATLAIGLSLSTCIQHVYKEQQKHLPQPAVPCLGAVMPINTPPEQAGRRAGSCLYGI